MKARIYVDASVLGGCEDDEFAEHSVRLMGCFVRGESVLVVSNLTVHELASAPGATGCLSASACVRPQFAAQSHAHWLTSSQWHRAHPIIKPRRFGWS